MPLIDSVREKEKKKNGGTGVISKANANQPRVVQNTPNISRSTGSYNTQRTKKVETGFKPTNRFAKTSVPQRNYETIPQSQWNAAQYAAYGRVSGDNSVFDMLSLRTSTRGDSLWMPTLGGQAVVPNEWKQLSTQLGYDGPFDQQFADDLNAMYGSDVRFSKALGVSTPTKKSSPEEWYGWLATQVSDALIDNNELNAQNDAYRKAYNDRFDQFTKINGRVPTQEEALALVDKTKYSKLTNLDNAYKMGTKLPILPVGTYYYPDCETGWYQAKVNGMDITDDQDYFEYAVQYYTNPVQEAPSTKKYEWSGSDLNAVSPEEKEKYRNQLLASGKREEAAAYDYACWAAQPHAEGISAEPGILDTVLGYYHDDVWVNNAKELLGDDYPARLDQNGEFIGEKGSKADYMDRACYELYTVEKNIDATNAVKQEYEAYVKAIQDVFNANAGRYTAEDFEKFKRDVEYNIDPNDYPEFKKYTKNGYDPDKYSYNLYLDENTIGAIEKRVWDGKDIDTNKVYTVEVDPEYEASFGNNEPSEPPLFYAQNQLKMAAQRIANRNNAETAVTDAVVSMAQSGAPISKGSVPVSNNIFDRMLDFGDASLDFLGKLWSDVFGSNYSTKLGANYTLAEAAAVDPVLAQLSIKNMPEKLTTADISKIVNAKVMSRVHDDDICLADGIINYALPGAKYLNNILMDRTGDIVDFNALTYRNVYNDRVDAGIDEESAARIATYAATEVNGAVESLGIRFEGDDDLNNAAKRLLDDMAKEQGALDSYDLFMAISDDLRDHVEASGGVSGKADAIMQKLLPALLVGSSDAATPGFRAETNQLTNDIANGVITPQDIVEAVEFSDEPLSLDFSKRNFNGYTTTVAAADELRENGGDFSKLINVRGVLYTRGEYSNLLGEAKTVRGGFLGSDRSYSTMSDDLKEAIGYDTIADVTKALYSASPEEEQYYFDMAVRDAVDTFIDPSKGWNTSPLMHGTTNLIGDLEELTSKKTEEEIAQNLENNGMTGVEHWIEQNVIKADRTGFARNTIDFFNVLGRLTVGGFMPEDAGILKQTAYGDMIDELRAYGKYLSPGEADALWNAFANGTASIDEIKGFIRERTNSISSEEVNAINNPQAMEESYAGLDAGLEAARNYKPPTKIEDPELAGIYAPTSLTSDDPETAALVDKMINPNAGEASVKQAYSPEELGVMGDFLDAYKSVGSKGFLVAMCDAENLKTFFGIDLDGTRFKNGADILNNIDPAWSKPYGLNPGYEFGMLEAVGRGMSEGYESVYKLPALTNSFLHYFSNALIGQGYDPMSDNTFGYRDFAKTDEYTAAMQQNVGTKGQVFVEQGTSEVVRNAVTSSLGAMFGEAVAFSLGEKMTGIPQTLASVAQMGGVLNAATTFASRLPFATNVFVTDFDKGMKDGKSVWNSTFRSGISAAIEVFTESAPFEKFTSLSVGGFSLKDHALNAASNIGASKAEWLINLGKNIFSEIKEEEASEFLGRLVDYGEGVLTGKSSGDALKEAFEGYGEEAKNTAYATAFTTLLFGGLDLGGTYADYIDNKYFNGQDIDQEELKTRMMIDFLASMDVPSPEAIAQAERDAALGTSTYQKVKRQNEQRFAQQTQETTSEYDPATQVPTFGKKVKDAESKLGEAVKETVQQEMRQKNEEKAEISDEDYAKAAEEAYDEFLDHGGNYYTPDGKRIPTPAADRLHALNEQGSREDNAISDDEYSKAVDDAFQEYIDNGGEMYTSNGERIQTPAVDKLKAINEQRDQKSTEQQPTEEQPDISSKISEAAVGMMNAIAEERAEEAQKAQEAASEQTEENPQGEPQEAEQAAPELPEGAQRVKDYVEHSEDAIDNAIIEKGAEAEAEKAVADDPGLQSQQNAIEKLNGDLQESEEKIAGMQQQVQTIARQTEQMYHAAVDEGIDLNSPQPVNASFQLRQQQGAVEAEIAKEQENHDSIARDIDEAQKMLDEATQKAIDDAKEKAAGDFTKKVVDYRKSMAEDSEKELNAIQAKQGGYDVKSMATTEEDKRNTRLVSAEQSSMTDNYARSLSQGAGFEETEGYVDPANYRKKLNYTPRRSEEWQDAAKQRQDYLTSAEGVQEEQQQRLLQDFNKWREANAPVEYIPVPQWAYEAINKRAAGEVKLEKGSERFTKKAYRTGDSAKVYAQRRYKEGQEGKQWTTAEELGYSDNLEENGIYSAQDFLNDDGTVTGLAYRAITAADPSFADNAGTLKINATNGGVDASLEHFSENNRYLILATPKQQYQYGKSSLDEDRYAMLTQKDPDLGQSGLDILRGNIARETQRTEKYLADLRVVNAEQQRLLEQSKDPGDYNPVETQEKLKEADEKLRRLYNGFRAQQHRQAQAEEALTDAETFLAFYTGNKPSNGRTFYVFDKSAIEKAESPSAIYQQAVSNTIDRVAEYAGLSDEGIVSLLVDDHEKAIAGLTDEKPSDVVRDVIGKRYESMSPDELSAALFDHFLQQELQKLYAQKYKGAVQVLRDTDESTAEQKAKTFIDYNGGMSRDSFGGAGFAEFSRPNYYDTHAAYLATEEGALKYLTVDEQEKLKINTTKAQYNVGVRSYARRFAEANGLSDADAEFISETYGIKSQAPKTIGKATIVGSNDSLLFGVPTKNVQDYKANTYIRGKDGSYDVDLALGRLKDKMKFLVRTSEDEDRGTSNYKLNLGRDSIEVTFTDKNGVVRKAKIGQYCSWWNQGSKFFPGFEEVLGMADKIVCNFPVKLGKDNKDSMVSFTIIPKTENTIDLERDLDTVSLEDVDGELAYLRGTKTTAEELRMVEEEIGGITDDDKLSTEAKLKYANAKFNDLKAQLMEALDNAETAAPDKQGYWTDRADSLRIEVHAWGERIRSIEDSTGNRAIVETKEAVDRYQKNNPEEQKPVIPKTAMGRYEKAKARYDALTDPDGPFFDDERYDHERVTYADVLPTLKQYADEEDAQNQQEQPKAVTPDPITKKVAEAITSTQETEQPAEQPTEQAKPITPETPEEAAILKELRDLEFDRADLLESIYEERQDAMASHELRKENELDEKVKAIEQQMDALSQKFIQLREARTKEQSAEQPTEKAEPITSFRGDNAFLSNFYEAPVEVDGITYRNAEAAFQAQKLENAEERQQFANLTGKAAKQLGRKVQLRADWNTYRNEAMQKVIEAKFSQNPEPMEKLKATGNADLVEGNTWNDTYWGVSNGQGENNLGKILMGVRDKTTTVSPEAKLAILKGLSDDGADVQDIRSKAIADYHESKMEGMSNDEKLDYLANLANEQKRRNDSYTIDPNTDYDQQLGDELKRQDEKAKSKEAKRLKAIGRTTYKTVNGVNNALAELDALEQKGYDVAEARDKLNKNLEAINNPYKGSKQALIDAADTPEMKANLQFFASETQDEAVDSIMDTMPPSITEEDERANLSADAMMENMAEEAEPRVVDTRFNQLVENVHNADSRITNAAEAKAAIEELSEKAAQVENLNGMIDDKAYKIRKMEESVEKYNKQLASILEETNTKFADSRTSAKFDSLAKKFSLIVKQTKEVTDEILGQEPTQKQKDLLEGLANDLNETRQLMQALEETAGVSWTDEQRGAYGKALALVPWLTKEIADQKEQKASLVDERNTAKSQKESLAQALIASAEGRRVIHNEATFNMLEYIGSHLDEEEDSEAESAEEIRSRRINKAAEAAKKLRENIAKSKFYIHGKQTTLTAENMMNMLLDGIVDEDRLKFDRMASSAANQELKAMKKAIACLEYGMALGDLKAHKISVEEYNTIFKKAQDDIFDLTKLYGYGTERDRMREDDARRDAYHTLVEYANYLDNNVFTGSIDAGMNALAFQHRILANKVEAAEQVVFDRFGISSTDDILSALNGTRGGRLPQAIMDVLVGSVYNSMYNKSGKRRNFEHHPLSRNLTAFRQYIVNALGDYAPIFNSIVIDPVLQGESKATDWLNNMTKKLDETGLETIEQYEAMGHILNSNMSDDEIIDTYGKDADILIKAKPVYQEVLQLAIEDQNAILAKNGQELIKWHKNYYPHQMREQNAFFRFLGIDNEYNKLPTGLLGETEGTVPGHQFASHTLKRSNENTENINWNAREVLGKYLHNAAEIIYQTDNLVRLNDVITQLGGNRKKSGDHDIDYQAVSPLEYSTVGKLADRGRGSLFVKALMTFRDQVAGKKTGVLDRAVESQGKRVALSVIQTATKMQSVAKVGGNLKSCALNFVPVVTSASMDPFRAIHAYYSLIKNRLDGIDLLHHPELQRSAFFKARCGAHREATCPFDKGTGWLFVPMEITDRASTAATWLTCYYNCLDKLGGVGNEKQAAQMADVMAVNIMSDKGRGNKGAAYNSTVGGLALQFTAEAVNQVGFLFDKNRLAQFHGGGTKGIAKALASLLAVFVAGFYGNKVVGSDSTIDPIGIGKGIVDDIKSGKKASDSIERGFTRFVDQLNPIDNITSGNIFDAPSISGFTDIFSALFGGGGDAVLSAVFDEKDETDEESNDSQWIGDLARALWGWVPGSTQGKRFYDTAMAWSNGYATNNQGKIKYGFEPTAGNIIQSALFGPNSTAAGQEYVRGGYHNISKTRAEGALENAKINGLSFTDALEMFDTEQAEKSKVSEATKLERRGQDNTAQLEDAKELRAKVSLPSNVVLPPEEDYNNEVLQKGIRIWQESGADTYPTEFTVNHDKNDPEYKMYIKYNGKDIPIDQATLDEMNADFFDNALNLYIEPFDEKNGDPVKLAKDIEKLKKNILKNRFGGE